MHVPEATSATAGPADVDWAELVQQIQANDPAGMEALHKVFSRGLRYHLARQIGAQDVDDRLHDIFLVVVRAIQRGDLREPERLMGFVRTVAQRTVAAQIDTVVKKRSREADFESAPQVEACGLNPEAMALAREKAQILQSALAELSQRDREILERFYLKEQTPEQICAEMNLTDTQFRLSKSRAKARLGEIGQKKINPLRRIASAIRWAPGSND
jgi:RNA polymerase sigma factor (sigma-70 family)